MFNIVKAYDLTSSIRFIEIEAPYVAKKIKPGQFIILRIDKTGERVPFTVAQANPERGTVSIIFQQVGKTTKQLATLNAGDKILDFVGPLGMPTDLTDIKKAAVVGGGLGCAIAFPIAKSLFDSKADVDIIAGFRSKDFVILNDEMKAVSHRLFICTDDGSFGEKGLVTDILGRLMKDGTNYDCVIAIGPLIMMKFVSELTRPYGIKTIVSMNPIMIDGTGMCGCCRVTVGGKTKFACVDGPDFDGHEVDFDEAIKRLTTYKKQEREAYEHYCKMLETADQIASNSPT